MCHLEEFTPAPGPPLGPRAPAGGGPAMAQLRRERPAHPRQFCTRAAAMNKQQEAQSDSVSTVGVSVKDYPPSDVYVSEPPPVSPLS